jgi:uncharacterized protein YndB with AHSA1/START domain
MNDKSTDAVIHEVEYPHPIATVWRAIAEREAISEWLMQTDFEPQVGKKFTFTDPDAQGLHQAGGQGWSGVVECEVLEVDKPRRLSYTWNYGTDLVTTVTFNLEPAGGGTRLRLEQTGFDPASEQSQYFRKGADYGWGQKFLKGTLPRVVARLAAAEPIRQ